MSLGAGMRGDHFRFCIDRCLLRIDLRAVYFARLAAQPQKELFAVGDRFQGTE
jgi:hypothetical protein